MERTFKRAEFSQSQLELLAHIARTKYSEGHEDVQAIPPDQLSSFQQAQRIWGERMSALVAECHYATIFLSISFMLGL